MIPSGETFGVMVVGLNEALVGAETALDLNEFDLAATMIRAAKANATALAHMAQDLLGEDDGMEGDGETRGPNTTDPKTCGHRETLDLPGQEMCRTCGLSFVVDEDGDGIVGRWVQL